jgi:sugar phosphate isomerase/epimerase
MSVSTPENPMISNQTYPLLCFTKPLQHLSSEAMVDFVADLGFSGLDLTIRETAPVTPANAEQQLPFVKERAAARGLTIGMVTLPVDCTDPKRPEWAALFRLCGRMGIPFVKLGYWNYAGEDYWQQLSDARKDLRGFEEQAKDAGVCVLVHTHGNALSQSASLMQRMIEGLDPQSVGAYLDTHHLSARGEDFDMAMDLVGPYLKMIAVKDGLRIKAGPEAMLKPFHEHIRMMPLGEGHVNFVRFVDALNRRGYKGPLTYHLEREVPNSELQSAMLGDLKFLKELKLIPA